MKNNFLRMTKVKERTGMSRGGINRLVDIGEFPKPIKLSDRCIGWIESEIDSWIENKIVQQRGIEK